MEKNVNKKENFIAESLDEFLNENEAQLTKVYNYYAKVDPEKLDKSKTINKMFLSGLAGKTISHSINVGTPLHKAWKAGHDRYAKTHEDN